MIPKGLSMDANRIPNGFCGFLVELRGVLSGFE
jgi:hypothetical protein